MKPWKLPAAIRGYTWGFSPHLTFCVYTTDGKSFTRITRYSFLFNSETKAELQEWIRTVPDLFRKNRK